MKKNLHALIFTLLLAAFLFVSYIFVPSSVKLLDQKINNSDPLVLDQARLDLIKEYGEFLSKGLPKSAPALYFYWLSNQRKLSDFRVKHAIDEIKNTQVDDKEIKVWSMLNMGAVLKTSKHTIAIDTANLPFSYAHYELAKLADIFLVTHDDGDHYDPTLLKKAAEENKKVILPKGFILNSKKPENIILLESGKTIEIDGVKITGYQTDHRGDDNFAEGGNWYEIESDGVKILHTGDGRDFKNKTEKEKVYSMKDIDILLGNIMLHSYNIRDFKPKVFVPLHMYKFISGGGAIQDSTIETVLNTHEQYKNELFGSEKVYLLPGESYIF